MLGQDLLVLAQSLIEMGAQVVHGAKAELHRKKETEEKKSSDKTIWKRKSTRARWLAHLVLLLGTQARMLLFESFGIVQLVRQVQHEVVLQAVGARCKCPPAFEDEMSTQAASKKQQQQTSVLPHLVTLSSS